jgi:hypothetical protein
MGSSGERLYDGIHASVRREKDSVRPPRSTHCIVVDFRRLEGKYSFLKNVVGDAPHSTLGGR